MYVHRSNRLEPLVDVLADIVAAPLPSPTEPEVIVVQSKGLERWLFMELARRLGVLANVRFPFPRNFIEEALSTVLGAPVADAASFSPERLVWSVAALLPELCAGEGEAFAPIARYLEGDPLGIRRVELAARIAETLDQYPIYRPDWVLAWEQGESSTEWQAPLWRALVARHGPAHLARRAQAFFEASAGLEALPRGLPRRVSVFGGAGLPPLFIDILAALAAHIEVHLFVQSPSREHWAEIRSRREIARALRSRGGEDPDAEASLALAEGNPLLASLGRVGRDFQFVLESRVDYIEDDHDRYVEPEAGPLFATMLTTLQADILALRHRRPGEKEAPPRPIAPGDRSIAVHACHGPMREVEVLREQLLALLHDDPSLEPRDIVVMTPDLEAYAPLVEAVFGVDAREAGHLPFRVAGRGLRAESPAVEAFFALLDTAAGRAPASAVLELLAREAVRARFEISEDEVATVRGWVSDANIRWGIDEAHRAAFEQPPYAETTWRFGLDRLLLGYAMTGDGRALFQGTLPFDDLDGGDAELLGRFASFCEGLFQVQAHIKGAHPVARFRDVLVQAIDRMLVDTDERANELQAIREALADMAEAARAGGFEAPVPLSAVRAALAARLDGPRRSHGFLSGGITICELLPMRGVPFRVVCLLGMSDDAFPRPSQAPGFDLLTKAQRRGDRAPRDEDRYLFLEALLAARERLVITYIGKRPHDDAALPPSVVVSELLDVIDESFTLGPAAKGGPRRLPREHVLVRHPLQPFSPENFRAGDGRVFSYAARYHDGAQALVGPREPRPPLFRRRLPAPPTAPDDAVTLEELASFFDNPMRALLKGRLGLRLGGEARPFAEREPLVLSTLDMHSLGTDLLRRALAGDDLGAAYHALRASGALPLGAVGRCRYDRVLPEVEAIAAAVRAYAAGARLEPREVDVLTDAARVTGRLREIWPAAQVAYRFGDVKARAQLRLWVKHLALECAALPGDPRKSVFIGRDKGKAREKVVRFSEVKAPRERLAELARLYRIGQRLPLCFFPEASLAYAEALAEGAGEDAAREAARKAFRPGVFQGGAPAESADPYVARVLDGRDPWDPALRLVDAAAPGEDEEPTFAELARAVFEPLIAHRQELSDADP